MKQLRLLQDKTGLTIIELLIASAILLMVLAVSYTFYSYAARSSAGASRQSDMQQNVRLAKALIEDEIKIASYVKVGEPADPENYHKIFLENDKIMIRHQGETEEDLLRGLSDNIAMDLSFTVCGDSFIEIMVAAGDGENNYDITSEVLILKRNIDNADGDSDSEIYYSD